MELIICDNILKNKILEQTSNNRDLINRKFMTMKDLRDSFYFKYNEETIYYLMNKYQFKYSVAKVYLDNMYYVLDEEYSSDKLNFLVKLKQELDTNNLLEYDQLFKEFIKNKKIIIYKRLLTKFELNLVENLRSYTDVEIKLFEYQEHDHFVYEFNTMEEEVDYVAYQISSLIEKGIDINDIKLTNINRDYYNTLKRVFNYYNLPIELDNDVIYGTQVSTLFLDNYDSDISKTINILKKHGSNEIIDIIIDICGKYSFVKDYKCVKDMIINDLKVTRLPKIKYKNKIEIVDYKIDDLTDKYVFMLSFNQENIPVIYKDEDYISDSIKENLFLETTLEKNKQEKELTIKCIKNIKNLTITYKLKTPFSSFYPSNLIKELNLNVQKTDDNYLKSYSILSDKLKCSKMLDNLVKYGIKDDKLDVFYHNYPILYMKYDNSFKGIDKSNLFEYLNNKLLLSYTSMNNYYKCAFRYYLSQILKLDIFEERLETHIGSIFHYILEIGLDNEIDIDKKIDEYIKENNIIFDDKDYFFLNKLKKELPFIIKTIKKQDQNTLLKNRLYEEKISIEKGNEFTINFVGVIDKIIYQDNIIALVDYKTGNTEIDLSLVPYGINMQLPIYLYLASNKFPNALFAGFYLQQILNGEIVNNNKDSYFDQKRDQLKLKGYSNKDKSILQKFDSSFEDSNMIKSMKIKNNGDFYTYSKVLTNDEINNLIKIVDSKIDECINNIENGKFDINPKIIENKNIGCKFCKFKDICFMENKDVVELKKIEDLSFLGGLNNA